MITSLPSLPSSDRVAYVVSTDQVDVRVVVKEKIVTLSKILENSGQINANVVEKIDIVKKEGKSGT